MKVTVWARQFPDAARAWSVACKAHPRREDKPAVSDQPGDASPVSRRGIYSTRFLDDTPELFQFTARDRATKIFNYLADVIVNGHPAVPKKPPQVRGESWPPCPERSRRATATEGSP